MEELLYWGAILGFYLWSAYRSNQKKAKRLIPTESPIEKKLEEAPQLPNNQKINILDFLNDAFEQSASSLEDQPEESIPSIKESNIEEKSLDDLNIKEQHLDALHSQLEHKEVSLSKHNQTLISVQKKYHNNPTKLGIVMKAIFEPPKAMQ